MVKTIKRVPKKPSDSPAKSFEAPTIPVSASESKPVVEAPSKSAEPSGIIGAREQKSFRWYEKDGRIQWDGMRDATKEALREFVQRPDLWEGLEIKKPEEAGGTLEPRKIVGDELVSRAYDFLGRFEQFVAKRYTGCSDEIAEKVFAFDEEEKAALVPVTVRLINKWGPDWLAKFNDEVEFAITLLSIQMSKMAMLRTFMERERRMKAQNVPAPVLLRPEKPEEAPTAPATVKAEPERKAETAEPVADVAEVNPSHSLEHEDASAS
jgi:hypothetical protein